MLELLSMYKDKQSQEVTHISRGLATYLICRIAASNNSAIFQEIYNYNRIIIILFPKPADLFYTFVSYLSRLFVLSYI
jgi:hypothetical protein